MSGVGWIFHPPLYLVPVRRNGDKVLWRCRGIDDHSSANFFSEMNDMIKIDHAVRNEMPANKIMLDYSGKIGKL